MTIHELLLHRYAAKKFDPSKRVSETDVKEILEAGRLSCSSANTQPWHVTVITNPELRAVLKEASYGQAQVTDASHLLVVSCVKDPFVRINRTVELIKDRAGAESAENYRKMITGLIPSTPEATFNWLKPQTYLALQAMILAATEKGIDSCPMDGFNAAKYAEILGFTDKTPTALLTLGYATEPGHPKIRVPLEDMVEYRV
jgi:nitroreductase